MPQLQRRVQAFSRSVVKSMAYPLKSTSSNANLLPIPTWFNSERLRILSERDDVETGDNKHKCIVYWMQRDMRVEDNWAIAYAQYLSKEHNLPLRVIYAFNRVQCKTRRHADFLVGGLKSVEIKLNALNIPMSVVTAEGIGSYCKNKGAMILVTDFHPLREFVNRTNSVVADSCTPVAIQIDAHNVVPCWTASDKKEVGARTLRTKINRQLADFMVEYPKMEEQINITGDNTNSSVKKIDWEEEFEKYANDNPIDESVHAVKWAKPGTDFGMEKFADWVSSSNFKMFAEKRNDPTLPNVISNLSPWINYGHISFQRLALKARALKKYPNSVAMYIEEGIVRRELSDNYVFYNPQYDSIDGAAGWVQETLKLHSSDEREYIYSKLDFSQGKTHDDLWNAAQIQLVEEGKMHGFLRMYWAKKILEWTNSPDEALGIAQFLNDHYALDGNDPNGYVGVGWSIMGVHDQGWKERDVFGKIRFMNYAGCKRKFKVANFVARYPKAAINAKEASRKTNERTSAGSSKRGSSSSSISSKVQKKVKK